MALRNPVFNNDAFSERGGQTGLIPPAAPAPYNPNAQQQNPFMQQNPYAQPGQPGTAQQGYQQQAATGMNAAAASQAAQSAAFHAQMEGMYAAPAAGALETDRMTVEDTVWKTAGLFGIMLVAAVVSWFITLGGEMNPTVAAYSGKLTLAPWIIGAIGTLVLGLVISFTSRKKVRPGLIMVYAVLEGLFVGGVSAFFEAMWPGVVIQATLATVAVVAVTLVLFANGKVRASKKATKIFLVAMIGYMVFSLLNLVLMLTGAVPGAGWGMRGIEIMGIPLGVVIGLVVVLMAAYSLVLDFDGIQQGVRNGAPRQYAWYGAFGIMVTVVWLYVEILRILAILRGND